MLIRPSWHVQVPPHHVGGHDERPRRRLIAVEVFEPGRRAGVAAGAVAMPALEDLILENNDRLPQPVLGDVGPKLGKGDIGHRREHGRERMLRQGSVTHCPPSSKAISLMRWLSM